MKKILDIIINRPVTTGMFFLIILVLGLFAFLKIPLELNPRVELPRVTISTSWFGTSSETMESKITSPIEEVASTVKGVKNISSESGVGTSSVELEFQNNIDMSFVMLELNEKISTVSESFPERVIPRITKYIPKEISEQRFMSYSISGPMEEVTLKKIADEKIKPALLSVVGVSDVQVLGGLNREIKVLLNEKKMLQFGLSLNKIIETLNNLNYTKGVGALKDENGFIPMIIKQETGSIIDIGLAPIKISDNNTIRLNQIASIIDGSEENQTYRRINGEPTITIEIIKEHGKNVLNTADNLEQKIQKLTNDIPDIKFRKIYDQSTRLREELNSLFKQSVISFLGVFLVLLIFLRNIRAPLIILSAIVFSIISVILLFSFFDITLNILTLSGLSLGIGMLVDNSIVVYENIEYHRKKIKNLREAIEFSVSEVSTPLMASTFTTAVVFLPFFFLPEELRQMFLFFGVGMGLSIIISLIFALTFIPYIAFLTSKKHEGSINENEEKDNISTEQTNVLASIDQKGLKGKILTLYHKSRLSISNKLTITQPFTRLIARTLKFRIIIIIFFVWLLGIPLWFLPEKIDIPVISNLYNNTIGSKFFQNNKEIIYKLTGGTWNIFNSNVTSGEFFNFSGFNTYLYVYLNSEQGTDIKVLDGITRKVEKLLDGYSQYLTTYETSVNENYTSIRINFRKEYDNSVIPLVLKSNLSSYFTEFGGIFASVSGYGQPFSSGSMFYESTSHSIEVLGYNYLKVKELAQELKLKLEKNPRVENVSIDRSRWGINYYEVVVEVNRKRVAEVGLTITDVLDVVRAYTSGKSSTQSITIKDERIKIETKFIGFENYQMSDLINLSFLDKAGKPIRMNELISVKRAKALSSIHREKQQYSRYVTLDFLGPYQYASEYINALIKTINLPFGYTIESGYKWEFKQKEKIAFAIMIGCALILVFMVTASLYESFKKPFIIILSVPMALIGLFLTFYFAEVNFGRSGYAGLILLIGVAVNNAIVLVDYIGKLISKGMHIDEAIVDATVRRAKPIIMTTITTIIGLLPFVIIGDKSSLWYGLSLSVIGGLISSTIMILFFLPSMYRVFNRSRN